jgi:hypothetical protein
MIDYDIQNLILDRFSDPLFWTWQRLARKYRTDTYTARYVFNIDKNKYLSNFELTVYAVYSNKKHKKYLGQWEKHP